MGAQFFAGIDIGTNAVRLSIVNVINENGQNYFGRPTLVRMPVSIAKAGFSDLSDEILRKLTVAMRAARDLMEVFGVESYLIRGTAALRESPACDRIISEIHRSSGLVVKLLPHEDEATLILDVLKETLGDECLMFVDSGGGSTELVISEVDQPTSFDSFKIGSRRLAQKQDLREEFSRLESWLGKNVVGRNPITYFSGGNLNSMKNLMAGQDGLSLERLKELRRQALSLPPGERVAKFSLNPDRAETFIAAIDIVLFIMEKAQVPAIRISQIGLSEALARQAFTQGGDTPPYSEI